MKILEQYKFKQEENIDNLKISTNLGDFDKEYHFIYPNTPDLRYYWDQEKLGLHISDDASYDDKKLQEIFAALITDLDKLEVLYIGRTKISNFSNQSLSKLKFLHLSENENLSTISLSNMPALEVLNASMCVKLREVVLAGDFAQLKKMDCSNGNIDFLKFDNAIFPVLDLLNIAKNNLNDLSLNAPNLKYLIANDNNIKSVNFLSNCTQLIEINLAHNKNFTNFIGNISGSANTLFRIDLAFCAVNLMDLEVFRNFEKLDYVSLKNTPIDKLYPEEVKQGWKLIKPLLVEDLVDFFHQKILLLGNTNIGKTNLAYWWINKRQPKNSAGITSTHGVNYYEIKNVIKTSNDESIVLHIWDFGGQDYFHATHQMFFSAGSLNLLLWANKQELRENQNDNTYNIDYWLRCIQQLSQDKENNYNTDTILIQNKFDLNQLKKPILINQKDIQNSPVAKNLNLFFTNILVNPNGDNKSRPKYLAHLQEMIKDIIDIKNFKRPKIYSENYELIKKGKEKVVFNINDLKGSDLAEKQSVAQYLHDRGLILYFKTCCENKIFSKPDDFLEFLYEKIFENISVYRISKKDIEIKLKESDFHTHLTLEEVIEILKFFNLVFEIPIEKDNYFIPQYLPNKNEWLVFFEKHQFKQASFIIKSDYFLMNQAMLLIFKIFGKFVKQENKNYLFWKDGIIIEHDNELLQIVLNRDSQTIEIFNGQENDKNDLLVNVIALITNIQAISDYDVHSVMSDDYIKCLDFVFQKKQNKFNEEVVNNKENIIEERGNKELKLWENRDFEIFINNGKNSFASYTEMISEDCKTLNYVKLYKKNSENENQNIYKLVQTNEFASIYNFNKYLPNHIKGAQKRLMISYSKDDLTLVNEFTKHLEPLVRNGNLNHWWYCTNLEAGQAWKDEIEPRLKTYEVICFMISSSFYNTDYIRDIEIKIALERAKGDNPPLIVPIILHPYHWMSDIDEKNLGKFTALPYTAKPVSSFANREEAWHIIGECLRVAIINNEIPKDENFWINEKNLRTKFSKEVMIFFEKIIKENKNLESNNKTNSEINGAK